MNSNYEKAKRIFESLRKRLHEDPTPEPNSGKHLEIVKRAVREGYQKVGPVPIQQERKKLRREQQAKQSAKASVSDDSRVYFPCPSCRTKLGLNFNDRGHAVDAKGSRFRGAFLCPSCKNLVPRSFIARMERKVRLTRQHEGSNESRGPLFLDDEGSF